MYREGFRMYREGFRVYRELFRVYRELFRVYRELLLVYRVRAFGGRSGWAPAVARTRGAARIAPSLMPSNVP